MKNELLDVYFNEAARAPEPAPRKPTARGYLLGAGTYVLYLISAGGVYAVAVALLVLGAVFVAGGVYAVLWAVEAVGIAGFLANYGGYMIGGGLLLVLVAGWLWLLFSRK